MPVRWIVSKPVDLALIIGRALAGYVYLLLFTVFQRPFSWLWWIWPVGFDGTHIFRLRSEKNGWNDLTQN
jgi:hypothetical protein